MQYQELHTLIKSYLVDNGPTGVTQLSTGLNVPTSTLQKYLDKHQNYFIKNSSRKWGLPEQIRELDKVLAKDIFTETINNQIKTLETLTETLKVQLDSTITLIKENKPVSHPVANETLTIHTKLKELKTKADNMAKAFKEHIRNVPEEYREILQNLDFISLLVHKGIDYVNSDDTVEIYDLLVGSTDRLSDEIVNTLILHQKGRTLPVAE